MSDQMLADIRIRADWPRVAGTVHRDGSDYFWVDVQSPDQRVLLRSGQPLPVPGSAEVTIQQPSPLSDTATLTLKAPHRYDEHVDACDEDPAVAETLARKHMSAYYLTVIEHYEFMSEHFKNTEGYGSYGEASDVLREVGLEGAGNGFVEINTWGSPSQIIEKLEQRRELIGDFDLVVQCKYGGLPIDAAQKSMRLFGEKVLPVIQSWR